MKRILSAQRCHCSRIWIKTPIVREEAEAAALVDRLHAAPLLDQDPLDLEDADLLEALDQTLFANKDTANVKSSEAIDLTQVASAIA